MFSFDLFRVVVVVVVFPDEDVFASSSFKSKLIDLDSFLSCSLCHSTYSKPVRKVISSVINKELVTRRISITKLGKLSAD